MTITRSDIEYQLSILRELSATLIGHSQNRHDALEWAIAALASSTQLIDEDDFTQTLQERDRYHKVADELAAKIAVITSEDIGEHSSANCPWTAALNAADNFVATSTQLSAVVQPVAGRDELQAALRIGLAEVYDCVTRESAENSIEYTASYNGRGREIDAQAMLVTAPQPATQAVQPDYTVHSCSYFCELPECIKRQHDELRDKVQPAATPPPVAGYVGGVQP